MLVEHAINNLGIADAVHAEYGESGTPIVSLLECSLNGKEITVQFSPESQLRIWHNADESLEQTTCNYGMNPEFQQQASQSGLVVSAVDETGEVRAVERPDHPFFVGTLYQPQLTTSRETPHPIFTAFVEAAAQRSQETKAPTPAGTT